MPKTILSGLSYKILKTNFLNVIEEKQQHHWIQHVKFYKEQLKFFQLQKKLKFVGQQNVCLKLNIRVFLIKS